MSAHKQTARADEAQVDCIVVAPEGRVSERLRAEFEPCSCDAVPHFLREDERLAEVLIY